MTLIKKSYVSYVSVSKRLDRLMHEPFVADLGYPADQAMVIRVVRGLQLLADEIDEIEERINQGRPPSVVARHSESDNRSVAAASPKSVPHPEQSAKTASGALTVHVDHGSPITTLE
jgi:hypothetical protein